MSLARFWFWLLALGVASGASADPAAWLVPTADYRANTLMSTAEGEMRGQVWASGPKERREFRLQGRRHVMILRKDLGKSYVLMSAQKMYIESGIDERSAPGVKASNIERKRIAQETVNGIATTRYRVFGDDFDATMWMTEQEIPVRVVTGEGVRMELTNVTLGSVDASRFEIPAGYKRFELPAPAKADLEAIRREHGR